jgi:deoxyribodipyrimidine photo-lyase
MIAARRTTWNFAMDRAVEWCEKLRKPLIVLEGLRSDYAWASDRLHSFIIDGMADNSCRLEGSGAFYFPFLECRQGAGKGLVEAMAAHACVVITDDYPCFFLPRMVAAVAERVSIRVEAVDSNGLLPMRVADREFSTAHSFRRFLQKNLPRHLCEFPRPNALADANFPTATSAPAQVTGRWPPVSADRLNRHCSFLQDLPIDHGVPRTQSRGGHSVASSLLKGFVRSKLDGYVAERNEPEMQGTSGLSPYLHFGCISSHQIFAGIAEHEGWKPSHLAVRPTGSRTGWWGARPEVEAYLDQLITWRELGFNCCLHRADYDKFDSLPDWALKTLGRHSRDERSHIYTLAEFETARTHDPLWNAAQTQLLREGAIHNYLRMVWGKKILEWTRTPEEALQIMIELNNKYALDGRDPNSYSGIFWCLGRYDRPWGPERPIFGTVRYMSSENTARKFRVKDYIERYAR